MTYNLNKAAANALHRAGLELSRTAWIAEDKNLLTDKEAEEIMALGLKMARLEKKLSKRIGEANSKVKSIKVEITGMAES